MSLDVGIVGAGFMGMVLAQRLAAAGHRVTVMERGEQIGGLATWHDFDGVVWDRFYHVVLPSDRRLLGLVRELGLESSLLWTRTRTGFYVDRQMHSISSNLEFLRFPLLSPLAKARLAFTLLYASRINDWRSLENTPVDTWLRRVSGEQTFERLWRPLLLAKLGPGYERVSAVFIWSYIKRMFSARDRTANAEQLGHLSGGYRQIFESLREQVEHAGGSIETGCHVEHIDASPAGGLTVRLQDGDRHFDRVVCTSPHSVLQSIVDAEHLNIESPGEKIEYLGVICAVLVTQSSPSPYYVLNIADSSIPFTGVIGLSNIVPIVHTGECHMTYLPRYLPGDDPEFETSDDVLEKRFVEGFLRMFPEFDRNHIVGVHINRARRVQPLQVLNYSQRVPRVDSRLPGFHVLNTTQFVNATLNNNEVVGHVDDFLVRHAGEFSNSAVPPQTGGLGAEEFPA